MKDKKVSGTVILLVVMMCMIMAGSVFSAEGVLSNEDFIRFHVIANSDSDLDQSLKLTVRDGIIQMINEELLQNGMSVAGDRRQEYTLDIEQARQYIVEHLDAIRAEASSIIEEEGFSYPVKVNLGVSWIPEKKYGNVTFPPGNYEALKIIIGEGKGQNWWCVLFPPLCLIGAEYDETMEPEELVTDVLLNSKYKELMDPMGKERVLKLKFKTLELLT